MCGSRTPACFLAQAESTLLGLNEHELASNSIWGELMSLLLPGDESEWRKKQFHTRACPAAHRARLLTIYWVGPTASQQTGRRLGWCQPRHRMPHSAGRTPHHASSGAQRRGGPGLAVFFRIENLGLQGNLPTSVPAVLHFDRLPDFYSHPNLQEIQTNVILFGNITLPGLFFQ